MPTLRIDDIELYYEVRGSGPRLLLCSGSGTSIAGIGPMIDKLAEHFEVLVHDQRCLGRSGIPERPPTMADYAADAAVLLDRMGWASTLVFGISFGGMVAQELAVTWPERIERLALLCTSPGGQGGSSFPLHTVASLPLDEQETLRLQLADSRYTPEFLVSSPFDQMLVDFAAAARQAPKSADQLRGEALQLMARSHHDVWDRLPAITCPTLIACGRFDTLAPPANSHAIASRVLNGEVREFEGGHVFVWQDRAAWPDVIQFLGG